MKYTTTSILGKLKTFSAIFLAISIFFQVSSVSATVIFTPPPKHGAPDSSGSGANRLIDGCNSHRGYGRRECLESQ